MSKLDIVTTETFDVIVLGAEQPVVVDFYADWCGPCKMMEPALRDIAREYDGEVSVVKLDVDANKEIAERYGVSGIPALLLFDKGALCDRLSGATSRSAIAAMIDKREAPRS